MDTPGPPVTPTVRTVALWAVLVSLLLVSGTACGAGLALVGGGGTDTVTTPGGTLRGTVDGGVRRFLGIRYAEAPVGPRRWAPPVPAGPWDGTRDAAAPGPICPQNAPDPGPETPQDEDCLFLNVTTPDDLRPGERLPVLLWWHGGGFMTGSGSGYGADRLAAQGRIVVVTANYRLGTLGYLGLPGLAGSGAFGFADQVQSLRWTRDNIAAFGGDPDAVTVGGQSAGGAAACALLTSPVLSELRVARVIVMSGGCSIRWPAGGLGLRATARGLFTSTQASQAAGSAAAAEMGCPAAGRLACLRSRPVSELLTQTVRFSSLAYGGADLPRDPSTAIGSTAAPVPVLYGGTRDEAWSFFRRAVQRNPAAGSLSVYTRLLAVGFGPDAARVAAQYPASSGSGLLSWAGVVTDGSWACPTLRDAQALSAGAPTFSYEFTLPEGAVGADGFPVGGAAHSSDLPMLFDREGVPLRRAEEGLSRSMIGYWSSFVRGGRPAVDGGPGWPAVRPGGPVTSLVLGPDGVRTADLAAEHRCGFWRTLG